MRASAPSSPRSTSMTSRRLAATGAHIRQWILATPFPPALNAAVSAQLRQMSGGREDSRSRCAPRPPPRICPRPRSPDSRRPSSTCAARRRAARRCTRCSPRCSTTAPSPTACIRASITARWRSRPACSTWCAATSARPASCSRSTPTRAFATWCSSPPPTASARRWCRARSTPTSSTSTSPRCARASTRSCAAISAARR